jgi:hypothetical protein
MLDPAAPDDRRILIEAEHPELADALELDEEFANVEGEEVDPRLHLTIHEIVASQLWDDDPPEAWQTAQRLSEAGYERHEIFHMLGSTLVPQFWRVLREGKPTDRDQYLAALSALPGSWEGTRSERRGQPTAKKRKLAVKAKKSARSARKRSRRNR